MKRKWTHPDTELETGSKTFRSIGQLEDTPEFNEWIEREFPRGAAELSNPEPSEVSRRSFMKLMGASTALAGLGMAACNRPVERILAYSNAPEWLVPGKPTYYATAMPRLGGAVPLYATTHEGRPTKLEPNDLNPDSSGTGAMTQASVLDLYSPQRSRRFMRRGERCQREDFEAEFVKLAQAIGQGSAKVGFVFGMDDSPTRNRLVKELATKNSNAKFYRYEAIAGGEGQRVLDETFEPGVQLDIDLSKAERILSLDADFLGVDDQGRGKDFSAKRVPEGGDYSKDSKHPDTSALNRLYVVEAAYTVTGGMADHRLRVAPSQVARVAVEIARALGVSEVQGMEVTDTVGDLPQEVFASWVTECAEDLKAHAGKSLVLAGRRQTGLLHKLALAINKHLGNFGADKPVKAVKTELASYGDLDDLRADLKAGELDHLILVTPANPAYDAGFDFAKAIKAARKGAGGLNVIHFGQRENATAYLSDWHVPSSHYLEQWHDARTASGSYCVVQPMILPLFGGYSDLEVLAACLMREPKLIAGEASNGDASPAFYAVKQTLEELAGSDKPEVWVDCGRDGFLKGSAYPVVTDAPKVRFDSAKDQLAKAPTTSSLELVFQTDASILDGRYIENGWLQEAPDPITKVTWDNVATISPKTAKELGVYDQVVQLQTDKADVPVDGAAAKYRAPVIKVSANGTEVLIAAQVGFGLADNVVVMPLGYGQGYDRFHELKFDTDKQHYVGEVGVNSGFDVNPLRRACGADLIGFGGKVEKTGDRYPLALTQEHHAMYGRAIARETTASKLEKDPKNARYHGMDAHIPENQSFYKQQGSKFWTGKQGEDGKAPALLNDKIHQWAMAIDLSACSGCNACLVACQAENNIPIVGKEQVAMGREMHWIRMDRYFAEAEDTKKGWGKDKKVNVAPDWVKANPAMISQPVACVQCENAPCETVCPVNATVHTEEGLNAMAYNRCIGTRYCANNCPYKARRFNYFDYNKRNPLLKKNLYKGPLGEKSQGDGKHLQRNPDVTVRMRGVIEKCTYCVQRLEKAKIRQKQTQKRLTELAGRPSHQVDVKPEDLRIGPDSVKTACQQACPAQAISFGNLLDEKKSRMVRAKDSGRNYDLLNYINTIPRTSFLARVKNPNEAMPDAQYIGRATVDMH